MPASGSAVPPAAPAAPLRPRGSLTGPTTLTLLLALAGAGWNALVSRLAPAAATAVAKDAAVSAGKAAAGDAVRGVLSGDPKAPGLPRLPTSPGPPSTAAPPGSGGAAPPSAPSTGVPPAPGVPSTGASVPGLPGTGGLGATPGDVPGSVGRVRDTVATIRAVWRWAPVVSQVLQGACLGSIAALLAATLVRAKSARGRAAAVVGLSFGALAAEPLVFLGQWLPAGLVEQWTATAESALPLDIVSWVKQSTSSLEAAAVAAGAGFPAAVLAAKGLLFVTAQRDRHEVRRLWWLGVPALAAVRVGQQLVKPLPGGGVNLALEGFDLAAAAIPALAAGAAAWLALVLGAPKGAPTVEAAAPPPPA